MKHIATHPGTGLDVVSEIFDEIAPKSTLHIVTSLKQAKRIHLDGLVLLGGNDISPNFYGQDVTYSYAIDRNRDAIEWVLVRRALDKRIPVFGICRGHQMLAVASGGSLYQDIWAEGATSNHSSVHKLVNVHKQFRKVLPTTTVNSLHHQAVKRVPFGFQILAKSADGLVEAIWRPGYLGVQFHPELMYPYNSGWVSLFQWFLEGLR